MGIYYSPTGMRKVAADRATARLTNFSNQKAAEFMAEKVPVKSPPAHTLFDIFLSYRYEDSEVVLGVYEDLVRRKYAVYLDRIMDPHLDRANVTRETANAIQNRLIHSKSLFYAATDSAAQSKWMPWELGFVDGYRAKSAIVPITEKGPGEFVGAEFVSVYPKVVPAESVLLIYDPYGTFISGFDTWRDSVPARACGMPKCPK